MTFLSVCVNYCQKFQSIPLLWVQKTGFTGAYEPKRTVNNRCPWMRNSEAECSNPRKYKKWVSLWQVRYDYVTKNHFWKIMACVRCVRRRKFSSGLTKYTTCRVGLCCNDKKKCFTEYHVCHYQKTNFGCNLYFVTFSFTVLLQ